jgi:hypothetical protein
VTNTGGSIEQKSALAALLIAFQAVLSLIVSLALFASAHRAARWLFTDAAHRRLELAWAMLVVTLIAVVIAVALASFASWSRPAALVFEAFVVIGALARLAVSPVTAFVGLAIAAAVISLVASAHAPGHARGAPATRNDALSNPEAW